MLSLSLSLSLSPSGPAASPTSILISPIFSTVLRVSWSPVPPIHQNGIITQYTVQYTSHPPDSITTRNVTVNGENMEVDLTGLEEYVEYDVTVNAHTVIGAGPYSTAVTSRTLEDGIIFSIDYIIFYTHCTLYMHYTSLLSRTCICTLYNYTLRFHCIFCSSCQFSDGFEGLWCVTD